MRFVRQTCSLVALLMFGATSAWAQDRRISGRVVGEGTGEPLAAASVNIVGTTIGAYTSEQGRFNLLAPAGPVTLRVRRIGYKQETVQVPAEQATELTVTLERDVLQLEKTVVTGAATSVASQNAAQDVAVVTSDQLNRVPTPTVENALQGKIAGAQISQNSGAPGGGIQVRLRGVTSIFGSSDPLYVIDGVLMSNDVIQSGINAVGQASTANRNASTQDNGVNRIADLNPADIETIEVLKGASASSIYGSKASNGVIVITTKKGQAGRPQVNVTQRVGTFDLANKFDDRRFTLEEAYEYAGSGTEEEVMDSATVRANYESCGGYCDTQEQIFGKNPLSYETSLSVRGGTDQTRYFASGLLHRDGGIVENTGYSKQSLRLNLSQLIGSKLTLDLNTNLAHSLTERGISNNDNVNATPYFVLGQVPSFFDFRPKNGVYPESPFGSGPANPLQTVSLLRTPSEIWRLIGSANLNYNVFSNERQTLSAQLFGGVDQFNQQDNINSPRELQFEDNDGLPGTAVSQNSTNVNSNWRAGVTHQYFAPSRAFSATTSGGLQFEQRQLQQTNVVAQDVPSGQTNVDRGAAVNPFANRQLQRDLAFYAQEEFLTLQEKLLLTVGVRGQRSTVNGDVGKFYVFPKSSVSYRFGSFLPRVDDFKLRAAFGQAGNQPPFNYKYTPLVIGNYDGNVGVTTGATLGAPNVEPEISTELEGGFDLTALNSRVALNFSVYQKTVTDVLLQPRVAPSTGRTQQFVNGGEMRNRGTEVQLALTPVQNDRATWVSRTTFSRNRGKVISLPEEIIANADGIRTFTIGGAFGYGAFTIQEGETPTSIFGADTLGNTFKYGDTAPDYVVGFSNELTVGPVRLYGLLDWQQGGDIINITRNQYDSFGLTPDLEGQAERVLLCNELGDCSPYIEDGSFVKLREVTLGYELPTTLTSNLFGGITRGVRLELSGRNLFTWTDYTGVDPEVSNFGNQNIIRNADLAPFPPTRSYFFSISADF